MPADENHNHIHTPLKPLDEYSDVPEWLKDAAAWLVESFSNNDKMARAMRRAAETGKPAEPFYPMAVVVATRRRDTGEKVYLLAVDPGPGYPGIRVFAEFVSSDLAELDKRYYGPGDPMAE